jgi:hypothetical protein
VNTEYPWLLEEEAYVEPDAEVVQPVPFLEEKNVCVEE